MGKKPKWFAAAKLADETKPSVVPTFVGRDHLAPSCENSLATPYCLAHLVGCASLSEFHDHIQSAVLCQLAWDCPEHGLEATHEVLVKTKARPLTPAEKVERERMKSLYIRDYYYANQEKA